MMNTPPNMGGTNPAPTLKDLLKEALRIYGRQERVAQAMGITPARVSRLLHGSDAASLSILTCLKLASVLSRSPSSVLRVAGKGKEAEMIEAMYGGPQVLALTPEEQTLILALRADVIDSTETPTPSLMSRRDQLVALMFSTIGRFQRRICELQYAVKEREGDEAQATLADTS